MVWRDRTQSLFGIGTSGGCIEHRLEWQGRHVDDFHVACCDDCSPTDVEHMANLAWQRTRDGALGVRVINVLYRLDASPIVCDDNARLVTDRAACVHRPELADVLCRLGEGGMYHGGYTIKDECSR
jgi:hypothetical protein